MKPPPQLRKTGSQYAKEGNADVANPLQNTQRAWQKADASISRLLQNEGNKNQAEREKGNLYVSSE
jgi:hypothetical protein